LHPDKVKSTSENFETKFLGYKVKGKTFIKEDLDLFKTAVYTEKSVNTIDKSLSRLLAFYFLGGCNSARFTHFFYYMCYAYER